MEGRSAAPLEFVSVAAGALAEKIKMGSVIGSPFCAVLKPPVTVQVRSFKVLKSVFCGCRTALVEREREGALGKTAAWGHAQRVLVVLDGACNMMWGLGGRGERKRWCRTPKAMLEIAHESEGPS